MDEPGAIRPLERKERNAMNCSLETPVRRLALAIAVFAILSSRTAQADVYWTLPAGQAGDWSIVSNWSDAVPGSGDTTYIVNGGTATVTQIGEICGALSLGGTGGSGTVQMTSGSLSATADVYPSPGSEYIGDSGAGTFGQSGGTNSISDYLVLGNNAGGSGMYSLRAWK
jgi:hypothetical protein